MLAILLNPWCTLTATQACPHISPSLSLFFFLHFPLFCLVLGLSAATLRPRAVTLVWLWGSPCACVALWHSLVSAMALPIRCVWVQWAPAPQRSLVSVKVLDLRRVYKRGRTPLFFFLSTFLFSPFPFGHLLFLFSYAPSLLLRSPSPARHTHFLSPLALFILGMPFVCKHRNLVLGM